MIKIRKAKPIEAKIISLMRRKTFNKLDAKDYSPAHIDFLNKRNTPKAILEKMEKRDMFCLVDDNKIIGVVDLEDNKIGGLYLRHDKIGKGYGKVLLNFIEDYAKKKGIKKVILYSTKYAYKFYLKHRYKLIKREVWEIDNMKSISRMMEKKL
jgi:GNAT superfamily N-acetyltransferase